MIIISCSGILADEMGMGKVSKCILVYAYTNTYKPTCLMPISIKKYMLYVCNLYVIFAVFSSL